MPTRHIIEWHCNRCGTEESIEQGHQHAWRIFGGLQGYTNNPKPNQPEPRMNGDICPQCATSLMTWWLKSL